MSKDNSLTIIFTCYGEKLAKIKTSIKRLDDWAHKQNVQIKYIIAQNGDEHAFTPTKNAQIYFHWQIAKGFGSAIKNVSEHIDSDYFYISSPDLPFFPQDLDEMWQQRRQADLLFGSKLHPRSVYQVNQVRKNLSRLSALLLRLSFPDFPVRDPNGTIFATTKRVRPLLQSVKDESFFFATELVLKAKHHCRIVELPVTYIKLSSDSSVHVFADSYKSFKQVLNFKLQTLFPLKPDAASAKTERKT